MKDELEVIDDVVNTSKKAEFKDFNYPLTFTFKIGTLSNDFTATDNTGKTIAYVRQKMFKLKEDIQVFDAEDKKNQIYRIAADEENPWAKVGDAVLSEIPLVGILTGYFFNPRYVVKDNNDQIVARFSKEKSFFGRRFKLEEVGKFKPGDDERVLLSLMMMSLLERRRG